MFERGGTVKTHHVGKPNKKTLQGLIKGSVVKGSNVHADALMSYRGLSAEYVHWVVDHAVSYVEGSIHTNGLESYWSLLKRTIRGTYVSVEPFHLCRMRRKDGKPKDDTSRPAHAGDLLDEPELKDLSDLTQLLMSKPKKTGEAESPPEQEG